MGITCIAKELSNEQRAAMAAPALFHPRYQITVGRTYLVLGISFLINSSVFGNCCLYVIEDDAGRCVFVPSALTEVMDGRVSISWLARSNELFGSILWPEEFHEEFFHDRLSNCEPGPIETFQAVINRLKSEFGTPGTGTPGT